jgi:hypothetical protein
MRGASRWASKVGQQVGREGGHDVARQTKEVHVIDVDLTL